MLFKTGTEPLPSSPRSHRLDESAAGYSLTGCSPALPVSASPTGLYRQAEDVHLSSNSNRTGDSPLDFGAAAGQTINYQGGPNQMIEVGQAGRSNSLVVGSRGLPLALCAECSAHQGRVGAVADSPECDQCEVDRQRAYIRSQNPGVTFTAWLIQPDGRQLGVTIQQTKITVHDNNLHNLRDSPQTAPKLNK